MSFDISSLQNPRVKYVVKLREDKHQRQQDGLMVVEGWTEIRHAVSAGLRPRTLINAPELASRSLDVHSDETLTVTRAVFEKIAYRQNPDGWLAIFSIPAYSLQQLSLREHPLVLVAESIEKPGNLGAILRTADAAGVDALLVCDPRVDLYNPNVIRASRGAIFSVACVETDNDTALSWLKSRGIQVLAATPSADLPYTRVDMRRSSAIVVGTEDEGLTDCWLAGADHQVLI